MSAAAAGSGIRREGLARRVMAPPCYTEFA